MSASAERTLPEAARVATSLPASNVGRDSVQPVGRLAGLEALQERVAGGVGDLPRLERGVPALAQARRRARPRRACTRGPRWGRRTTCRGRGRGSILRPRISSAPIAEPWMPPVFCLVGEGQPMIVRSAMIEGLPVSACAAATAAARLVDVLGVARAALGPVDLLGVPAVRLVAREHVLGEGDVRVVLDRDLVVVPDHDEVAGSLVARERGGLGGHTLLQVAVGRDDVHVVVERALAGRRRRVEQAALAAGRHGHADRGREALAEGARGDLDAVGVLVLGVARSLGAPGAQRLDVLDLQAVAGEEEPGGRS